MMSTQKREVQLKADLSGTISENGNDQGGISISPATTEKTSPKVRRNNKTCAFFQRRWKAVKKSFQKNRVECVVISAPSDPEPLCVPDPEVDLVDEEQLCVAGPSAPEPHVTTESTQKREVQLKTDLSSSISENGNDHGGMNMTPATTEKTSSKVKKSNKICAFFRRRWKAVKKSFQKNRVEPIGISAESDPEPLCVPDPEPEPEVDLVDAEQLCVSAPSGPEPQVATETQETQVTTELSMLRKHFLVNIFQLERRMCKCKVLWTPVTEVWPSVCNTLLLETARDRAKLKEMGITHILNTAVYKEYLQGEIDSRAEYYKEMDITYYGVLVMDEHRFDISKDLFPASEFIHKALSNTENKLLVHCIDGVSRSATFFLAYLMTHHEILLEDAIDHVIDRRWIRPNRDFLKQLISLDQRQTNCVSSRQMSYNKSFLVFLLVPGTALLLYLCYSPITSGQYKKEPQTYPPPKRTTAPSKDPVTEEPEIDTVQEEPGLYHVAYPRKYKFIIDQPTICEQQKPFLVILVPVPPWDAEARSGIRRTWGEEKLIGDKVVLVLFILGLHSGNDQETMQEKLRNESQQYQDLLQSNFLDSYKNLTIKTMMMMEWLNRSCQQASFAVKADADVLINMNNLINMLGSLNPVPTNYMTGLVWYGNVVIRNPFNKFYLPYDVYPRDTYPPYPLGMCYIISLDLPQKFIQESKHIKPIFIEDAYLGICLEHLGIVPTNPPNLEQFVVTPPQYNRCYYSGLIAVLTANTNQMTTYWKDINSTSNPC